MASLQSLKVRIAALHGAVFLSLGIMLPFLPVWFSARGLSADQIAVLLALHGCVRIGAAPAVTYLADKAQALRGYLVVGALVTAAGLGLAALADGYAGIAAGIIIASVGYAPIIPLAEAYSVTEAGWHGFDYGRLRLWGSVSFILGSLGAGLVLTVIAAGSAIWLITGAIMLISFAALALPAATSGAGETASGLRFADALTLGISPGFVVLVLAAGLAQASHALIYGFGSVHWQALGYGSFLIGCLWSVGVLAEIVLFALGGKHIKSCLPATLIAVGASAGVVRWLALSLDPVLPLLIALQLLHALSFGLVHLGTMAHIRQFTPGRLAGTAQGLYSAVSGGVIMSLVTFGCGPLYRLAGSGGYLVMSVIAALGFLAALVLWRISPRVPPGQGA